jgi:hypothetical protein
MKSVIYFVFKINKENYIDDIQSQINHDVKQYIITDIINPSKSIYNKVDNIFYFKDKISCLNGTMHLLNYLETFNCTETLLLNTNKQYDLSQLTYKNISNVKEEFAVVNNIL